jgi:hypothetical protein
MMDDYARSMARLPRRASQLMPFDPVFRIPYIGLIMALIAVSANDPHFLVMNDIPCGVSALPRRLLRYKRPVDSILRWSEIHAKTCTVIREVPKDEWEKWIKDEDNAEDDPFPI